MKFNINLEFINSILDYSSFYDVNLTKCTFVDCSLKEEDFSEADLSRSLIKNCDLEYAIFHNTKLEESDLRLSKNYSIDINDNNLNNAHFSITEAVSLLDSLDIKID